MPKDYRVQHRPQFDMGTHCTVRCAKCHFWLSPFKLLHTRENSASLNRRITQKTGWAVGGWNSSKTLCPRCIRERYSEPSEPIQEAQKATEQRQGRLFGLFEGRESS